MATLVWRGGDLKAPFSIDTTPRCRGGCNSIPWIVSLYSWSLCYSAEWQARWHHVLFLKSLAWLDLGLNPGLPDHWWTLLIRPMARVSLISWDFCILKQNDSWDLSYQILAIPSRMKNLQTSVIAKKNSA